jgi:hypothetical protein
MLNSHLQSESWETAPPIIGPSTKATANVAPIIAPIKLGRWEGPTSTRPICVKLYRPDAPIPWKARHTILRGVSLRAEYRPDHIQSCHTCSWSTTLWESDEYDPRYHEHVSSSINVTQFGYTNGEPCNSVLKVVCLAHDVWDDIPI